MTKRTPGKRPILVTGTHRSGTTWVGKMIAAGPDVVYLSEPFNLNNTFPCPLNLPYWYFHIDSHNSNIYRDKISACLDFRSIGLKDVLSSDNWRLARARLIFLFRSSKNRRLARRALIKDPLALASAPWLAETYGMNVVITIRHPLAFVGSLKKINWRFDFANLINQPRLMNEYLGPFKSQITDYAHRTEYDIIDEGALIWNIMHHLISRYRDQFEDWLFVTHEDLSKNPETEFERLYESLGLNFCPVARQQILQSSNDKNKGEATSTTDVHIDSLRNITSWKNRLNEEEIERIMGATKEISARFYPSFDLS